MGVYVLCCDTMQCVFQKAHSGNTEDSKLEGSRVGVTYQLRSCHGHQNKTGW